ncbi:Transposase (putative), gypsy type [Corchorus capsularis]|uniref:Transposase (Putative), gypsy type n=1 Tax=Corchorus capsularis TaxID=210143 RepID=A0A1R3HCA6_COCAP|nr:Transposase (putative), gypsy type [Corchorus capsularis]
MIIKIGLFLARSVCAAEIIAGNGIPTASAAFSGPISGDSWVIQADSHYAQYDARCRREFTDCINLECLYLPNTGDYERQRGHLRLTCCYAGLSRHTGYKPSYATEHERPFSISRGGRRIIFNRLLFEDGFRLPAHPFFTEITGYYGVPLTQFLPNTVQTLMAYIQSCIYQGWKPEVAVIRDRFKISKKGKCWYSLNSRDGSSAFAGSTGRHNWRQQFFAIEIHPDLNWDEGMKLQVRYLKCVEHTLSDLLSRTRLFLSGLSPLPTGMPLRDIIAPQLPPVSPLAFGNELVIVNNVGERGLVYLPNREATQYVVKEWKEGVLVSEEGARPHQPYVPDSPLGLSGKSDDGAKEEDDDDMSSMPEGMVPVVLEAALPMGRGAGKGYMVLKTLHDDYMWSKGLTPTSNVPGLTAPDGGQAGTDQSSLVAPLVVTEAPSVQVSEVPAKMFGKRPVKEVDPTAWLKLASKKQKTATGPTAPPPASSQGRGTQNPRRTTQGHGTPPRGRGAEPSSSPGNVSSSVRGRGGIVMATGGTSTAVPSSTPPPRVNPPSRANLPVLASGEGSNVSHCVNLGSNVIGMGQNRPENKGFFAAICLLDGAKKEIDSYFKVGPISYSDILRVSLPSKRYNLNCTFSPILRSNGKVRSLPFRTFLQLWWLMVLLFANNTDIGVYESLQEFERHAIIYTTQCHSMAYASSEFARHFEHLQIDAPRAYHGLEEHIGANKDQGDVIDASLVEHGVGSTCDRPLLGEAAAWAKRFKEALLGFVRSHLGGLESIEEHLEGIEVDITKNIPIDSKVGFESNTTRFVSQMKYPDFAKFLSTFAPTTSTNAEVKTLKHELAKANELIRITKDEVARAENAKNVMAADARIVREQKDECENRYKEQVKLRSSFENELDELKKTHDALKKEFDALEEKYDYEMQAAGVQQSTIEVLEAKLAEAQENLDQALAAKELGAEQMDILRVSLYYVRENALNMLKNNLAEVYPDMADRIRDVDIVPFATIPVPPPSPDEDAPAGDPVGDAVDGDPVDGNV